MPPLSWSDRATTSALLTHNASVRWSEQDDALFAADFQPAILMDLLNARGLCSHRYLTGSGLFYDDVLQGDCRLSVHQWLAFINNARALYASDDLSFRWGHDLWPGYYGDASQCLRDSNNLQQALKRMQEFSRELCPLMTPVLQSDQRYCMISWQDNYGLGQQSSFVAEAYITGLVAFCRWRSGQPWPWRIGFAHSEPRYLEQYQVHLGNSVFFDVGSHLMLIERDFLEQPWPVESSPTAQAVALHRSRQRDRPADGLLAVASRFLHQRRAASLEDLAQWLGISAATCKRKLKKHRSSFQQLQDQMRLQQCQYRFHVCGWSNEQVAADLGFSDVANFRRAYKRWCGMTPSASKHRIKMLFS